MEDKDEGDVSIVWGDMNKYINDDKTTGIKSIMDIVGLVQAYKEVNNYITSSRQNKRIIYHCYISEP